MQLNGKMKPFSVDQLSFYSRILDFLESVYTQRGTYTRATPTEESPMDVLVLNFTKVVNDCRAILMLADNGFFIQAGILCRSTSDSCHLMMHILFEGDDAPLVREWLNDQGLRHWRIMRTLNTQLSQELNMDVYSTTRSKLDDFVHASFRALQLYPSQSPGPTPLDSDSFQKLTFWDGLIQLFLVSCLMTASAIAPDHERQADDFLRQMGVDQPEHGA
jgi:hypothetical protein